MPPPNILKKSISKSNFFLKPSVLTDEQLLSKARSKHPKPYPMNSFKPVIVLVVIALLGISFQQLDNQEPSVQSKRFHPAKTDTSPSYKNGKTMGAEKLPRIFTTSHWYDLGFPVIDDELALALRHHRHVLGAGRFKDGRQLGDVKMDAAGFETVIELLLQRKGDQPDDLHQYLDAHQVWGADHRGNVLFTGYYTPVIKARKEKAGKYQYPLYAKPRQWDGPMPTRKQIEKEGALEGLGLELGYTRNPIDISIMQLQGSGYVDFVDTGERRLFRYAGHNGHRYRNIQRFFTQRKDIKIGDVSFDGIKRYLDQHPELIDSVLHFNPSYTFFHDTKGLVKGAGQVPLMKGISIAADPAIFPPGSVLLAAFPVVENGSVTHHEYRILLPQDVGSAIKGPGHIDVYCGVGTEGKKMASNLHHYGKIWLLTPKEMEQIAATF